MGKTTYTYEEAYEATLEYFSNDSLATQIWLKKYALKDSDGTIYEKTPAEMHKRIAKEIARIESKYPNPLSAEEIFGLIDRFKYIVPQGNIMYGLGNEFQVSALSDCFAIDAGEFSDSVGGVMLTEEELMQLLKRRGNVGLDLSHIRPKGSPTRNVTLRSQGVAPIIDRFANSTKSIVGDSVCRTNICLDVNHPDAESVLESISRNDKDSTLCIKIDDAFMSECSEGNTKQVWQKIMLKIKETAQPIIIFSDTIKRNSIADCYADEGFSGCASAMQGGLTLAPYEACALLAINLYSYIENPFMPQARFNFHLFERHVSIAQKILDDIVDLELERISQIIEKIESDPEPIVAKQTELTLWKKIKTMVEKGRRIGLGTTAEADMIAAMGIEYETPEATLFSEQIHKTLALATYRSSVLLAKERGSFEIYNSKKERENPFVCRLKNAEPSIYDDMVKYGRRNISCLSIFPCASSSYMTRTTQGITPLLNPIRRQNIHKEQDNCNLESELMIHPKLKLWLDNNGFESNKDYKQSDLDKILETSPYNTSSQIAKSWEETINMQGRLQKWIDQNICSYIYIADDLAEENVYTIIKEAWRLGCKSICFCKDNQGELDFVTEEKNDKKTDQQTSIIAVKQRPKELDADVVRFQNNKEKWIAFVGLMNGRPYEIFTGLADDEDGLLIPKTVLNGKIIRNVDTSTGKSRYDFQYSNRRGYKTTIEGLSYKFDPEYWNYAKLISGVLRYGMPIDQVIKLVADLQLGSESINNWKNGVERALKKYIPISVCPNCGQRTLKYQDDGYVCTNCGVTTIEEKSL